VLVVLVAQPAMAMILLMSFAQELYVRSRGTDGGVACVLGAKTASTASKTRGLASKKGREI